MLLEVTAGDPVQMAPPCLLRRVDFTNTSWGFYIRQLSGVAVLFLSSEILCIQVLLLFNSLLDLILHDQTYALHIYELCGNM